MYIIITVVYQRIQESLEIFKIIHSFSKIDRYELYMLQSLLIINISYNVHINNLYFAFLQMFHIV